MSDQIVRALTTVSAVGAALSAGVFLAFSTFVMRALDALPPPQGIAAMQSINRFAPNPLFMLALFGTALTSVALVAHALAHLSEPGAGYRLAGGALYLAAIFLTVAYHVPRNNALASLDPGAAASVGEWADYVSHWTAWNHVRTLSSLVGAAALLASLRTRWS